MKKDGGAETTGGHDRRERKNFLRVKLKKKKKKKKRKKRSQSGESQEPIEVVWTGDLKTLSVCAEQKPLHSVHC